MRWMLIERDNVTHPSEPDANGKSYIASFEFFPFHEGATFAVYKGMLSGDARRRGQFCVVKTLVEKPGETGELNHVMGRAREAQRLAVCFNNFIGYRAAWFAMPSLARLKHVSDFNGLFRCISPHDKRLVRDEHVLLEAFIEGKFQVFNSNNGTVLPARFSSRKAAGSVPKIKNKKRNKTNKDNSISSNIDCDKDYSIDKEGGDCVGSNNMAQAFGHYVWFATRTSVICGLEGVFSNSCYMFTTPVIHSISSSFGATDGGPDAISQFFASHRCTNVCYKWPVYSPLTQSINSKKQINFFAPMYARMADKPSTSIPDRNIFVEEPDCTVRKGET